MLSLNKKQLSIQLEFSQSKLLDLKNKLKKIIFPLLIIVLSIVSVYLFFHYLDTGLGLAYNDARSRLDIGRRVVEGLKPGLAQIGSVWLPLTHLLMVPTVWNDWMWHSGFSGAVQSMIAFVATSTVIYKMLEKLNVGVLGRIFGVLVFVLNLNILYLQSTALTELMLLATMTYGAYEFLRWHQTDNLLYLIRASFFIMLSTLIRYDGWFLFFVAALLVVYRAFKKKGYYMSEGMFIIFCTLGGLGIVLWFLWNLVIFNDPLYFAFGPFSAHAQQSHLDAAGVLQTKHNIILSLKMYWYAMVYNSGMLPVILGIFGAAIAWFDKKITKDTKVALLTLLAPFLFNVIALYLGHSVLFVQGISGNTWFNIRYGIMMIPSLAIFAGLFFDRLKPLRFLIAGVFMLTVFFQFANYDAVTIEDGMVGSSQKNVSEVSNWLKDTVTTESGFIMISAASHDAIIFSSGLPMKRFIHEGTGAYWDSASVSPDRWARWIVMRTHDENDLTFKAVNQSGVIEKYELVAAYPFADVYQLKEEFLPQLNTEANLKQYK